MKTGTTVGKLGTMANYVLRGARAHYVTERPMPGQITQRRHPFDIIDEVLQPLLGSLPATEAAMTTWLALRRAGYPMDSPEAESDDE